MPSFRDAKIITNYANYCVKTKDSRQLNKSDWDIIGKDLIPNDKIRPFYTKKIVMNNLELANNKILQLLESAGISKDRGLKVLAEAEEIARKKENSADLIKIADRYNELHDLKPQKVQITETRQQINYDNLLPDDKKQEVKRTITAKTTVNKANGEEDNQ